MAKQVHTIVHHAKPSYDIEYGSTEDNRHFRFLTNLNDRDLEQYKKALETYDGPEEFAVGEEAYGFDEEEGVSWRCHDLKAFYVQNEGENLDKWWRHLETVKQ